jgi:hypothetical protein
MQGTDPEEFVFTTSILPEQIVRTILKVNNVIPFEPGNPCSLWERFEDLTGLATDTLSNEIIVRTVIKLRKEGPLWKWLEQLPPVWDKGRPDAVYREQPQKESN